MLRRDLLGFAAALGVNGAGKKVHVPKPPSLFFYAAPFRRVDGQILSLITTVEPESVTSQFPEIEEMDGVVVMPYWATVNPAPGEFEFKVFDKALDYWSIRKKSIIIGVATVGYPIEIGPGTILDATPPWLLGRSTTYKASVRVLRPLNGSVDLHERQVSQFPVYWDYDYITALKILIKNLSRYDGHPAISSVRVSTGITGEDNPTFDGLKSHMPGFSNLAWLSFCKRILSLYQTAFRRTRIEFDIDRVGWIRTLGTDAEKIAADKLLDDMSRSGVFIAMDGFDPANVHQWLSRAKTGPARNLDYIADIPKKGGSVGLEGSLMAKLTPTDADFLAKIFSGLAASRLVVFWDGAAALNFSRNGYTPENALSVELLGSVRLNNIALTASRYFIGIGAVEKRP